MRAFWYDNKPVRFDPSTHPSISDIYLTPPPQGDQRELHDSGRAVDAAYLQNLGVLYFNFPNEEDVNELARSRNYKNRDVITVSPEKMGDIYEEKVKSFFHEHLHEDEEIRYIRDGKGFFDVRSEGDEWVRIRLEKDDLIVSCFSSGLLGTRESWMLEKLKECADERNRSCQPASITDSLPILITYVWDSV